MQLIRAILLAPVDLLWNGGIGTYVKASMERNEAGGGPGQRPGSNRRVEPPLPGRGRGWQPRPHSGGPGRVRPRRGQDQHRFHRQLRRSRTARTGRSTSRSSSASPQQRAGLTRGARSVGRRRRPPGGRANPLRQLPAGADDLPGGAVPLSTGLGPRTTHGSAREESQSSTESWKVFLSPKCWPSGGGEDRV